MRRVLLTGATGFVGGACIAALRERDYSVHTVSTRSGITADGVTIWPGDLLDTARLPMLIQEIAPECLLHAAWDVSHGSYWSAPSNLDWLAATATLLSAFQAAGGRRAVGVGTCAEYGWSCDIYQEFTAPLRPATCYGMSKLAAYHGFQALAELGVSTAWARLFYPLGPGEQCGRLLPSVINRLMTNQPADCTAGTQLRDFMYIDDVGAALAALLDSDIAGPVNVGSGVGTAVRDVILQAADYIGRRDLIRLDALPMRLGDPNALVADVRRLTEEVGFHPSISIETAIERTVDYWAQRHAALCSASRSFRWS